MRPTPHAFFVWRYLCFAGVVCIIYYVLLWKRAKKNNKEKRIMNNGWHHIENRFGALAGLLHARVCCLFYLRRRGRRTNIILYSLFFFNLI